MKHLPNFITILRIVGTIGLLLQKPLSLRFFVIYLFTGATDVLDGFIARKMKVTSELGAKLDSIADLLFYTVMMLRIFPILWEKLPVWIWYILAVIISLRLCSYGIAAIKYRRFASLHTILNKVTGAAVFAIPFFIISPFPTAFCTSVCLIALCGTLQELVIHIRSKEYGDWKGQKVGVS